MIGRSREALRRLGEFLTPFEGCFLRKKQRGAVMRYVDGLIGPSERKNLQQMWASLEDPGDYQALHHFITESTWPDQKVWRTLRETVPDRSGLLIVDDTGIPKQGRHSVGVQRQYSGTMGKIGNCQVAVSTVLRSSDSTWLLAMDLYLPETWTEDPERRAKGEIPEDLLFRTKWQIALEQIRTAIREGFQAECVLADAGYGECLEFRSGLGRMGLFYAVGVTGQSSVFEKPPHLVGPKQSRRGPPRPRRIARNQRHPISIAVLAKALPRFAFRTYTWRNGSGPRHRARVAALRVVPAQGWQKKSVHEACWLLVEKRSNETKYFLSNLPPQTTTHRMVEWIHARWSIEQNYRDLKNELGFDHFAGRRYEGWNHHAVLTALAYTFLQMERRRGVRGGECLTLPVIRKFIRKVLLCLHVAGDRDMFRTVVDFHRNPPLRM